MVCPRPRSSPVPSHSPHLPPGGACVGEAGFDSVLVASPGGQFNGKVAFQHIFKGALCSNPKLAQLY